MKKEKVSYFLFSKNRFWLVVILTVLFVLVSVIPVKVTIAFHKTPIPQAIIVLGGSSDRMVFTAKFWQSHSDLDIWVSDHYSNLNEDRQIFQQYNVPNNRLRFDGRATDTVTNFTTVIKDLVSEKLQHLYLITSDYHMRRSRAIATIVLGSQGVVVTPVAVSSSSEKSESLLRVVRDCGRSLLWILTGRTGASFNPRLEKF
ncbi:YdcF family protein [Tolypothrix campylonemoides VB511288]|nr:YdcF family protein [Tolypothrix campylonemoides VB511288]